MSGVLRINSLAAQTRSTVAPTIAPAVDQTTEMQVLVARIDVDYFTHRQFVALSFFRPFAPARSQKSVAEGLAAQLSEHRAASVLRHKSPSPGHVACRRSGRNVIGKGGYGDHGIGRCVAGFFCEHLDGANVFGLDDFALGTSKLLIEVVR